MEPWLKPCRPPKRTGNGEDLPLVESPSLPTFSPFVAKSADFMEKPIIAF
jgi:hypothetical protein